MKKFKLKFREVKSRCREVVEAYRNEYGDDRKFPQFNLGALSQTGRRGVVQLTWKPKGKDVSVFSDGIYYESLSELSLILQSLGQAWEATNKKAGIN